MFIALKRLVEWVLLFFVFFILTIILYKAFLDFSHWIIPQENIGEPIGKSIKVINMNVNEHIDFKKQFITRLRIFYLMGE